MKVITRVTQKKGFVEELQDKILQHLIQRKGQRDESAEENKSLKGSQLHLLDPFIDANGILQVGRRLRRVEMGYGEKHPTLLPKDHHVSRDN